MSLKKSIALILVFLIVVFAGWMMFFSVPGPWVDIMHDRDQPLDLTALNIEEDLFMPKKFGISIPEKMYTPEQLKDPEVAESLTKLDDVYYDVIDYATHIYSFKMTPGESYGISMRTADYAMRIYINGELTDSVGNPGLTKEENIPRVGYRTYYFEAEQEINEIVLHVSNYVHKEGAYGPTFVIGTAENIATYDKQDTVIAFVQVGALLFAFLYNMGTYLLNTRHLQVLFFSLVCLFLAFQGNRFIPTFFPDYNWQFAIRFEYIDHVLALLMIMLFLRVLFPILVHKPVAYAYYGICTLYILMVVILDSKVFTSLRIYYEVATIIFIVYIIVRFIYILISGKTQRSNRLQYLLAFAAILVMSLAGAYDILLSFGMYAHEITLAGIEFITPIAMLFFVFCFTLIVSLDYSQKDRTLAAAEQRVADAVLKYEELLKANEEMDPAKKLSALGLSPRELDIAYLLLDGKMRLEIAYILSISAGTVSKACARIYKKAGCRCLVEFANVLGLSDHLNIKPKGHADHPSDADCSRGTTHS